MINRKELLKSYLLNNIVTIILFILTIIFYKKINLGYENISKLCFCLILPLISLLQSLFLIFISLFEYKLNNFKNSKIYKTINKYLNLIFNIGQGLILLSALNVKISILTIFMEMLGLFVLIVGNYFPKLKESNVIKSVSFVVNNDINKWNIFTRVSGYTYIFIGLVIMLLGVFEKIYVIFIAIGLILISGIGLQLYSLALGKRQNENRKY